MNTGVLLLQHFPSEHGAIVDGGNAVADAWQFADRKSKLTLTNRWER